MAKNSGRVHDKILIDIDEYLKLLNIQQKVKTQEDKINFRLANEAQNSTETDSANKEATETQTGSGQDINLLSELVAKRLQKKFQFVPLDENLQHGFGSGDLITEFPQEIKPSADSDEKLIDITPSSSVVHKSTFKDSFDDERLIKLVPKSSQNKAEKLLSQLKKHPGDITWQSNGTIFLNQTSLFESNMFELFPKLFKKTSHPEKVSNLLDVASTISTLGLGHLINPFLTQGLIRRNTILNHSELKQKIEHSKNWYFLGQ
jgi:hypothetical protein